MYKFFVLYLLTFCAALPLENLSQEDLSDDVTPYAQLKDVSYFLFTPKNPNEPFMITENDVLSLQASFFNPKQLTVFIIHGWNNNNKSNMNFLVRTALLDDQRAAVNIFVVDWSGPAHRNYIRAKDAVPVIGEVVGEYIVGIIEAYGTAPSNFALIGHSLGAHVCGQAGSTVQAAVGPVDHIVGLDPAKPFFSFDNTEGRLDETDATFVHVIHTSARILGFKQAIGTADYYPNGGEEQPGCVLDIDGACAHSRSYEYYAESLTSPDSFLAQKCHDYSHFIRSNCSSLETSHMGGFFVNKSARGEYFLKTRSKSPFSEED